MNPLEAHGVWTFYGRPTTGTPHREADPRDYCPEPECPCDLLAQAKDQLGWALLNSERREEYARSAKLQITRALELLEQERRRG